jgi:hypothetical protein
MPAGPNGEKRPAGVIGNTVTAMRVAAGEEVGKTDDGKPVITTSTIEDYFNIFKRGMTGVVGKRLTYRGTDESQEGGT